MKFLESSARGATFSADRRYRWTLWRRWDWSRGDEELAAFIGVNPSTADELVSDPTVTRCINFAKSWGYSGMVMLNLFAWRETNPYIMRQVDDPIGALNDEAILDVTGRVGLTVACWGVHGQHHGRAAAVKELLGGVGRRVSCLKLTKDGIPGHPLYLRSDSRLIAWL